VNRFLGELRFSLRKFVRAPGLSIAVVVTLALGIGANSAIFSLVDGVWLRPLAIADPAHLISLASVRQAASADAERDTESSYAEFQDLRTRVPAFSDIAASSGRGVVIERDGELKLLLARVVSENYFPFMGMHAALGRLPGEQEMLRTDPPVLVLGYSAWKTVFHGDPSVVGSVLKLSHGAAQVVAVLAPGCRGTDRMIDPQVYVSRAGWLVWDPSSRDGTRKLRDFDIYARLNGATLNQARQQLNTAARDLQAAYPDANTGRTFTAQWETQNTQPQIKVLSLLLMAVAAAVLITACVNVLNLLLALNDARRREMAMRVALGANRAQLLRQVVMEYGLLALAGMALALVLAQQLVALVPALMPNIGYPLGFDFRIDLRVLAAAAAASLASVLICGLIPGLRSSQVSPLEATRTAASSRRFRMPARKAFVVVQLALSMALLMATGLLVRTLIHIGAMDMGFRQGQNAVLLDVAVNGDGPARLAEFAALADRMRALPGVKDASVARVVPFPDNGGGATKLVLAPGEVPSSTAGITVWFNWVDDAYFRVIGVPLMRGRTLTRQDSATGTHVAVINQTLAKRLFGTDDAVGRHFRIGRDKPADTEVVGVARDGKYGDVTETPQPYLYLPFDKDAWGEVMVIATTAGEPGALLPPARQAVRIRRRWS
jgi:predicted permease